MNNSQYTPSSSRFQCKSSENYVELKGEIAQTTVIALLVFNSALCKSVTSQAHRELKKLHRSIISNQDLLKSYNIYENLSLQIKKEYIQHHHVSQAEKILTSFLL